MILGGYGARARARALLCLTVVLPWEGGLLGSCASTSQSMASWGLPAWLAPSSSKIPQLLIRSDETSDFFQSGALFLVS